MDPHLISTLILTSHWLIVARLSIRVVTRRPPVGVSVAWLAVVFGGHPSASSYRDMRSLRLNFEISLLVCDPEFTEDAFRLLGPLL